MFYTAFVMSFLITLHARFTILPLKLFSQDWAKTDATNWFYGWRELGEKIISEKPEYVITRSHQLSSEITYYINEKVPVLLDKKATKKSQFDYWNFNVNNLQGLYVTKENKNFSDIDNNDTFSITRQNTKIREYKIYKNNKF